MQKNKNKKIRLVVDANAWVSSLLMPKFHERLAIVFNARYRLMVSEGLFDDLANALRKPRLEKRIKQEEYDAFVHHLRNNAELIEVRSVVDVCRDPDDNFLLALAKDGNADYLITGDKDLLVLKKFGRTKILLLSDFESEATKNH